jgi:hypothetical protein
MIKLPYKLLKEQIEECKRVVNLKQHEKAVLQHHGWCPSGGKVCITRRGHHILIVFSKLWQYSEAVQYYKLTQSQLRRLKDLAKKTFKAKVVSWWEHTNQGISIELGLNTPDDFNRCIQNYLNFKCPRCSDEVFCKCGVLDRRFRLFTTKEPKKDQKARRKK